VFDAQCLVKTGIEMMKGSFNVRFLFSERRAWIVSHFEDLWILDHDESTNQETTKMELPDVHLYMHGGCLIAFPGSHEFTRG